MEALGEHLGNRGVAQPVELRLVAVVCRHRRDERPGRILRGDRVGRERVAAGLGQRLLDGLGVGRMQVLAGDVAIGGQRLVDIGAEMPVDDAGRCALAVEQHLQAGDFFAAGEDDAGSFGPSLGAGETSSGCPVTVPPSSGWRSIGSRVTTRGCGSSGYAPGASGIDVLRRRREMPRPASSGYSSTGLP